MKHADINLNLPRVFFDPCLTQGRPHIPAEAAAVAKALEGKTMSLRLALRIIGRATKIPVRVMDGYIVMLLPRPGSYFPKHFTLIRFR